jgi:hypothetical protein
MTADTDGWSWGLAGSLGVARVVEREFKELQPGSRLLVGSQWPPAPALRNWLVFGPQAVAEVCAGQVRAPQSSVGEVCVGEGRAREVHIAEVRAVEASTGKVRAAEFRAGQVGAGRVCVGEVNALEVALYVSAPTTVRTA